MAASCDRDKEDCKKFDIREKFIEYCKTNQLAQVTACVEIIGVDVNTVSRDGKWTGLYAAAHHGSTDVLQWLLAQPGISMEIKVPNTRDLELILVFLDPAKPPTKFKVTCPKDGSMGDLCMALAKLANIPAKSLIVTDVWVHRFHKIYTEDDKISVIKVHDDVFVYEMDTTDPSLVTIPVYLREKSLFAPASLFGRPVLVSLPKSCSVAELYSALLTRMSRFAKRPSLEDKWTPNNMFSLHLVNSYGNAKIETIDSCSPVVTLNEKSYLSLDWDPNAKAKFFNGNAQIAQDSYNVNFNATALAHLAVKGRSVKCVEVLANSVKSISWNGKDADGDTPLLWSIKNGEMGIAKVLVKTSSCDVNIKDQNGDAPLMLALKSNNLELAKVLLQCPRVNLAAKDGAGLSLEDVARSQNMRDILQLLPGTFEYEYKRKFWSTIIPECPVCLETFQKNVMILHCANGHFTCRRCEEKMTRKACPKCKERFVGRAYDFMNILKNM